MTEKTYTWPFSLHENAMTKDDQTDYLASVQINKQLSLEDIADAVIRERSEYRYETLLDAFRLMEQKIRDEVYAGNRVQTLLARFSPSISGVFNAEGEVDPKQHKCDINIAPTAEFRQGLSRVKLHYTENMRRNGGAAITLVLNRITDRVDGPFAPGEIALVKGNKIKCLNADGTGKGRILLTNRATGEQWETNLIGDNYPRRLTFIIPHDLPSGEYKLQIETYYTTGTWLLRKPRVITYATPLLVNG